MKPLLVANWKMNLSLVESTEMARTLADFWEESGIEDNVDLVICPPVLSLTSVANELYETSIRYGAQNVFWQERGAFTGETAPRSLAEIGCEYVIVGHSERRKYIGETDDMVSMKANAVVKDGMIPIICVGETMEQRSEDHSELTVMTQVIQGVQGIDVLPDTMLIIAYEPVWVIGTGQAMETEEAQHMVQVIRQALLDVLPRDVVEKQTRILYGGSVDAENVRSFTDLDLISGALIGTASNTADKFIPLIQTYS